MSGLCLGRGVWAAMLEGPEGHEARVLSGVWSGAPFPPSSSGAWCSGFMKEAA